MAPAIVRSKKKLLVILGAGSSAPCGMPTVQKIGGNMKKWSAELLTTGPGPNYFSQLWDLASRLSEPDALGRECTLKPNYERILGDMIALTNWDRPAPWGNTLRMAVHDGRLLTSLNPDGKWMGPLIVMQIAKLLGKLARYMRGCSSSAFADSDALMKYKYIISRLRDEFDLGIYNLNYDPVAITAWREAFTGFQDDGRFAARVVLSRKEWNFIYHLHGSVHHSLKDPYSREIVWKMDLEESFCDGDQVAPHDQLSERKTLPRTTLIAGGYKLDQLLFEPFQSFHASLVRHVYEADAILIGGYGFGDAHVNNAAQNRLLTGSVRPPIIVITKSNDNIEPIAKRIHKDIWSYDLMRTLATTFTDDRRVPCGSSFVSDLIRRRLFEESASSDRVSVWHGGFIEAADCLDSIVCRLAAERSA